ncbi:MULTISPECIES: dihydroxyacetone kinase subunit DhaL [unclassified Paenibacillus]|uniref:dihydroxyacetone kinase subunit DhaL n=1 Tax=unclassified Paenibacillus TaxID=185978 RepID=UPI001C10240B|nr:MULTISPECIES: dihydroxyacetone kinase subunit DhaL [unclassified Paenibacillus]MBU5444169.1 dihydroxyacetone kinase subunit L [Paenibacillus sp. MSJ-34]CAH0122694.1 PEP-dependent dihydroxyacetone kinase 2, ADP-binding subunit DhaL [Paenibacillus sp. CECT 9249]
MNLSFEDFKYTLYRIAARIEEEKDYLSELDRALGDGDHGVTMSIGWKAIVQTLDQAQESDFAQLCRDMAMSFLNAVGSSVGPLYATAFLRGGAQLQGKKQLDEEDIVQFWVAAVEGIRERGKAEIGDKTMIDTWIPAVEALTKARNEGNDVISSFEAAVKAGETGMKQTAELLSKKGRSSRLGERSIGHMDPGAVSAYMILSTFFEGLKNFAK